MGARTDQTKRKQLADEVQKVALSEGTYVPSRRMGSADRMPKNVRDILRFGAPIFWNNSKRWRVTMAAAFTKGTSVAWRSTMGRPS